MALLSVLVNGAVWAAGKPSKTRLEPLTQWIIAVGYADPPVGEGTAQSLDLPYPPNSKSAEYERKNTEDGAARLAGVILDKSNAPSKLIFKAVTKSREMITAQTIITNLSGDAEIALVVPGRLDENGKVIPGSANDTTRRLDLTSASTKEMVENELAFWLEGKHWKKASLKSECKEEKYEPPFCWSLKKPKAGGTKASASAKNP
jgi:hypothetical protein